MITTTDLELRAGARILLEPTTLRVQPGDRIGLVGRNGAGKTTSLRTFAGETLPHAGRIDRTGPVGYRPQDPRTGDPTALARDRVLSAGGLVLISHDVGLLDTVVNKVWYLDANRSAVDVYNVGWKTYLQQREADEKRRHRERANAERKIEALKGQADKMRAKATKTRAAHQMDRRAAALAAGLAEVRVHDKGARLRFPAPAPCGRTPLTA